MKILLRAIVLLSITCFMGCVGHKTYNDSLLILDLEMAIDNPKVIDLAEISEDIDFMPLDGSSPEGLIGEIENIAESKTGFYIHDDYEMPVKVFDKTGKFISTRGQIGRGPNEVLEIANMAVDFETGNLYVNGGQAAYDNEGRMFARNDSVWNATHIAYFNGQLVASRGGYILWNRDPLRKITFLTLYSPDLKREGIIEVFDKGSNTTELDLGEGRRAVVDLISDIVSDNGESLLVKEGRSDTVFYYTGTHALRPAYCLNLGDYALPEEILDGLRFDVTSDTYVVTDITEGDRSVFVTTMDLVTKDSLYLIFEKSNPSDGFMATGLDGKHGLYVGGVKFTPCYIRDNHLVGYMQALDIVDNADAITNPDLKALAATLKEDSNPVIVVAKLKK